MDIAGLSISIEVDISGFVEAMEEILAIIETIVEELEILTSKIKTSFGNILQAGDNTNTFLGRFGKSLKEILEPAANLIVVLGAFVAVLTLIGISAPVAVAIGAVTVGVTAAVMAWKNGQKAATDTNQVIESQTQKFKNLGDSVNQANKYLQNMSQSGSILNKTFNQSREFNKGITFTEGTKIDRDNTLINQGNEIGNGDSTIIGSGDSGGDDFLKRLQKNYDDIKKVFPNHEDLVKVKVKITADHPEIGATLKQYNILNQSIQNTTNYINQQKVASKEAAGEAANNIKILKNLGMEIGTGILEDIGKAASGEKNPFGNLFKLIGDAIKKLGQQLLAVGAGMEAGAAALPILGLKGASALAAGAALLIAGTAMGAIKMASGGIVSGSSFVNVGEYAGASHNPEVIAPLDKLNGYMGAQHQTHSFEIQGDKLVSILSRVDNNSSFALGSV